MLRELVLQAIYQAISRANELRPHDAQLACEEGTALYGPGGAFDSLELVSFILDVEETVNVQNSTELVLADDKAMSQRRNPFRDVATLADYVAGRLEEVHPCPIAL
jgi:hypothetical protein